MSLAHGRHGAGVAVLALVAALSGCGSTNSGGQRTDTSTSLTQGSSRPVRHGASPTRQPRAAHPGSSACHAPADVLAGVYHPSRLHVLAPCQSVSGTVLKLSHEQDGDLHIRLDTHGALTNSVNRADEGGALVVEFMARDGGHLRAPAPGDSIRLTGAWVLDANHGWNELHPVWSERLNGVTYRSGPQYGGSPAGVGSSEAAAACHTPAGATCAGYGSAPAPPTRRSASPASTPAAPGPAASPSPRSSAPPPPSHLHAGEFCSASRESFYEANGYTCSPGSDGRNRLHSR